MLEVEPTGQHHCTRSGKNGNKSSAASETFTTYTIDGALSV